MLLGQHLEREPRLVGHLAELVLGERNEGGQAVALPQDAELSSHPQPGPGPRVPRQRLEAAGELRGHTRSAERSLGTVPEGLHHPVQRPVGGELEHAHGRVLPSPLPHAYAASMSRCACCHSGPGGSAWSQRGSSSPGSGDHASISASRSDSVAHVMTDPVAASTPQRSKSEPPSLMSTSVFGWWESLLGAALLVRLRVRLVTGLVLVAAHLGVGPGVGRLVDLRLGCGLRGSRSASSEAAAVAASLTAAGSGPSDVVGVSSAGSGSAAASCGRLGLRLRRGRGLLGCGDVEERPAVRDLAGRRGDRLR